ncbi:MAG: CHC2 zinc finger domain-containing protein [Thermomicrobiales bacterium]
MDMVSRAESPDYPHIATMLLYRRDLAMLTNDELRLRYEHFRCLYHEMAGVYERVMLDHDSESCDYRYAELALATLKEELAAFVQELAHRTEARRRAVGDPKVPVWPRVDTAIRDRVAAAKAVVSPLMVAESYLGCIIQKSGHHYITNCPMPTHGGDDRTPSLTVYADCVHCYGCGFHGDQIDMILHGDQRPGMHFLAALDVLESLAGMRKGGVR